MSAAVSDLPEKSFSVDDAMEAIQLIVGEDTDVLLSDDGKQRVYGVLEKISSHPARIEPVQFPPIKGAWIDGGYVIVTPAGSGPDKAPALKAAILAAAHSAAPAPTALDHFIGDVEAAEDGWQPIDTAPTDGTHVLVALDGVSVSAYCDDERGDWWEVNTHWTDAVGMQIYPKCWMPMPKAPS